MIQREWINEKLGHFSVVVIISNVSYEKISIAIKLGKRNKALINQAFFLITKSYDKNIMHQI